MEKRKLLSIGEFSSLTGLNIKKLRYYDSIDILKPAFLDQETNYRYYTYNQKYIAEAIKFCTELDIPLKDVLLFIEPQKQSINYEKLIEYGKEIALKKIQNIKSNLSFLETMQKDIIRSNTLLNNKQEIFMMPKKICYLYPYSGKQTSKEFHIRVQHIIQYLEKNNLTPSYEYGLLSIYKNDTVNTYIFIDLEEKPKDKNIPYIIIPEQQYDCRVINQSNIKLAPTIFKNLFKEKANHYIIETEIYLDEFDINNHVFEMRCSL